MRTTFTAFVMALGTLAGCAGRNVDGDAAGPEDATDAPSTGDVRAIPDAPTLTDGSMGTDAHTMDARDASRDGSDVDASDSSMVPPDGPIDVMLSAITVTRIPDSDPDLVAPGRGAELWNGVDPGTIDIPVAGSPAESLNTYNRFNWTDLEGATEGSYDFSRFDTFLDRAIDAGHRFSFGIMPVCDGCAGTSYAGAESSYPQYLHSMMQSESPPDWIADGNWIPNWNSESYLTRWEALLQAVAAHIASGSHNGVAYHDAIYYIDIRGYGNYGEWHVYPWYMTIPAGADATSATLIRIIDSHVTAFPNHPLVVLVGAFDDGNASRMPLDVTYHALTARNAYGPFGWRRDNYGDTGLARHLDGNPNSYMGVAFAPIIMNAWQHAPIVGEPLNDSTTVSRGGTCDFWDFPNEVSLYHVTSFGNGNIPNPSLACAQTNVREASRRSGYRLVITDGAVTRTVDGSRTFVVQLDWQNLGLAPTYERWTVTFELRDPANHAVWSGPSSMALQLFLPATTPTTMTDRFTLPSSVAAGTYSLVVVVRDPTGFLQPLPLAITGRAADGSYALGSVVVR